MSIKQSSTTKAWLKHLEETLYQTVSSIREHIQVTYNVTYSISGLRHLLRRLDFVYKKPKAIPGKADKVVLYNRYYERFADFKAAILEASLLTSSSAA